MNYHNITKDDMLNGFGLRVCLQVSGCTHKCNSCQNPQTHNVKSGIEFDSDAKNELIRELNHDYISGITFTGGDPLHKNNVDEIYNLIKDIKERFGDTKDIWLYTGYVVNYSNNEFLIEYTQQSPMDEKDYIRKEIIKNCSVVVDGRFDKRLEDIKYHWAGSTNQKVIDVNKTILNNSIITVE